MPGGKSSYYDEDDYDDGYDDDDYYEDDQYDDYDKSGASYSSKPTQAQQKQPAKAKAGTSQKSQQQQPARQSQVKTPTQSKQSQQSQQAQFSKNVPAAVAASSSAKVPAQTPQIKTSKQNQTQSVASASNGGQQAVSSKIQQLKVDEEDAGPESSSSNKQKKQETQKEIPRRPVSEYQLEDDLQKAFQHYQSNQDQTKQKLHLIVLGHVDAGKSTLMGRLLYELGLIDQREVHKNQKEASRVGKGSFSWAWILDERPEERERGVTVDVAQSRFATQKFEVTLMDAPGHRDFVPRMIGGAATADAALLVVDGRTGEFEAGFMGGGQTREHAQLARSLGIEQLSVVISKLDTCGYSEQRFDEIRSILGTFLAKCGFRQSQIQWTLAAAPVGINLVKSVEGVEGLEWFKGNTVVETIDNFSSRSREVNKPARIPVSSVFQTRSLGNCAAGGKLEGGVLKVGQKLVVMPSAEIATVKALEVDGKSTQFAFAGDGVDIGLSGIEANMIRKGDVLCHPEYIVPLVRKFRARVVTLEITMPLLKGSDLVVHCHTAEGDGFLSDLITLLDAKTGEVVKQSPKVILKNQSAVVEITVNNGLCVEAYSDYKALGRLALRQSGKTVAVGIISEISE
eukprot:TRINITY_DN3345_c1_g1_i1.p1 TRINITY_DN3345_c1_g1~~TRINITY_DN3345_c1_g1_i1.p1  ORF type:complete len:625 (+),score=99.89 TRINITY_DN3345_c1_g1_i1:195-2069(+)